MLFLFRTRAPVGARGIAASKACGRIQQRPCVLHLLPRATYLGVARLTAIVAMRSNTARDLLANDVVLRGPP
jgi:hypothetical protein